MAILVSMSFWERRPIAVVEAKSEYRLPSDGLQQAKEYAELLDLKFAYSTNGPGIVEHDPPVREHEHAFVALDHQPFGRA